MFCCWWWQLSDLSWGYGVTTTNELRVRRPSYTDRILVHSLPTRALELVPQVSTQAPQPASRRLDY
jgi:hypothetical protein